MIILQNITVKIILHDMASLIITSLCQCSKKLKIFCYYNNINCECHKNDFYHT